MYAKAWHCRVRDWPWNVTGIPTTATISSIPPEFKHCSAAWQQYEAQAKCLRCAPKLQGRSMLPKAGCPAK